MNQNQFGLDFLFLGQDNVLQFHISKYPEEYKLLDECMSFVLTSNYEKLKNKEKTEMVFTYFFIDAYSSLVNTIRLAFYGADTDSLALSRTVLENVSLINYIIENNLYEDIYENLENNQRFDSKYSWKSISKNFPDNDPRKRLYGNLSNLGSHNSPARLRSINYEKEGQTETKFGAHYDNPGTDVILLHCIDLVIFFIDTIKLYYGTFPELDQTYLSFSEKLDYFENKYYELINLHSSNS